jgi:Thioesterase domain
MPDISELSEAKRALLEKYLRGDLPQTAAPADGVIRRAQVSPVPLSYADSRSPVVAVQSGGSKRPFFYSHVHWWGGAFYCFTLASHLGSDQPFYVLEPYRFEDLQVMPSIEAMAAAYLEEIRAIQPEGPYLLGGFCGGALITFEIAHQLRAQGQAVDLLVLIEAEDGPSPRKMLVRRLVGGFIRHIGGLIGLGPDKQLDYFLRLRHVYHFLRSSYYRKSQSLWPFPTAETLRQDWIGLFVWIISSYLPRQYPGKVVYFWAREEPFFRVVWRKVTEAQAEAKEFEVHIIPGTHTTCRTDHIHELAAELKMCLCKAQEAPLSERA